MDYARELQLLWQAFSFDILTDYTTQYDNKTGTFKVTAIPSEYYKAGRHFAIQVITKDGQVLTYPDTDDSENTITVAISDLQGYAFNVIYSDTAAYTAGNKATTEENQNKYFVQKGDTLSEIAKKLGKTVAEMAEENKLINPNRLQIGEDLIY